MKNLFLRSEKVKLGFNGRCIADPSWGGSTEEVSLSWGQKSGRCCFCGLGGIGNFFCGSVGGWLIAVEGVEGREVWARHCCCVTGGAGMLSGGVRIAPGWSLEKR